MSFLKGHVIIEVIMLTRIFQKFITKTSYSTFGSNRLYGIITPTGVVYEKTGGYRPDIHHHMAIEYGYKGVCDILKKGGVRFSSYEGGINFEPGTRIEYEYEVSTAKKLIAKHIRNHPSNGYSILGFENGVRSFKEYDSDAKAINSLI